MKSVDCSSVWRDVPRASERWQTPPRKTLAELHNLMDETKTVRRLLKNVVNSEGRDMIFPSRKQSVLVFAIVNQSQARLNADHQGLCESAGGRLDPIANLRRFATSQFARPHVPAATP